MAPLLLIPLLLKLAPDLARWIGGSRAEDVVNRAGSALRDVLGTDDPVAAEAAIADPAKAAELRIRLAEIAAAEHQAERQADLDEVKATLADTASARSQTVDLARTGSAIAWGAPLVSVLIVCGFGAVLYAGGQSGLPTDPVFQMLIGTLSAGFGAVVQYWLGSSVGSLRKDSTIAAMGGDLARSAPVEAGVGRPFGLLGPVTAPRIDASTLFAIVGTRTARQQHIIADLGPLLASTLARYGINTPLRQAHFLAQCAHECDRFCTLEEYASGRAYEGRRDLGNIREGDGVRFKGRGLIQTTGRSNYNRAAARLSLPLLEKPEMLATPGPALEAACLYWQDRGLNRLADQDDILAVTRAINGGTNGLNDRRVLTARAKRVLGL